ncbi:hypothetical protein HU200_003385 [Digitaria exilis]|uniref:Uncharacterized protein n=1 Tax=Digitaria exilis TaxID=1010633 RepID=A0A835FU81_9POAL|nr:hypothetical protein HU200_003385 [Digitaria exilis]
MRLRLRRIPIVPAATAAAAGGGEPPASALGHAGGDAAPWTNRPECGTVRQAAALGDAALRRNWSEKMSRPWGNLWTWRIGIADDGEEFSISCNNEGVEFVAASVDCSLQEAKIFGDLSSTRTKAFLYELAVFYPAGSYGFDDPLLSVQVTEFSCGGVVLGVTWNHAVADGAGIAQFLTAVGELARGSPSPSVVPVRCDDAVSSFPPLTYPVVHLLLACPDTSDVKLIVPLDITVSSALINRVKAEHHSCFDGQPCTTFEVVLAVLWRCRVRATMSNDPGSPNCLAFTINMRKVVGAKDGYYGNCIATQLVAAATSGMVAEAGIVELVTMIKRAKAMMGRNGSDDDGDDDQLMRGVIQRYDMMLVTSWRNIGFERVDFGSGAPARVMSHTRQGTPEVPICMVYPPCKGKDGVNLLLLAVKEEHAGAFFWELAMLERNTP